MLELAPPSTVEQRPPSLAAARSRAALLLPAEAANDNQPTRRLWRDSFLVGGSTAICHILAVATSLLFRGLLNPDQMGVWQALKMFLSYSNYANLGVSKGATREWSVAQGRGQTQAAARGLNLAFTVNTISSVVYAAGLTAAGVWMYFIETGPLAVAWAVGLTMLGWMVVLQRHVTFHVSILRAGQQFGLSSRLSIVEAGLTLVLGIGATWLWGLYGLYAATVVTLVASWVFLKRNAARDLAWDWNPSEIKRLVAIGSPILLAGVVMTLFRSLDKLMILGYWADCEFQLGCYSLPLLVGSQLYGIANMLSIVMAPRYAKLYGATNCRQTVAEFTAETSHWQAAVLAGLGGLAMAVGPWLFGWMFPAYEPGLAALGWTVIGSVAFGLSLPASQYLVAVGLERRALATVVASVAIAALGLHIALRRGGGLVEVAMAMALANAWYAISTIAIALGPRLSGISRRRLVFRQAAILLPTLALAAGLEHHWPGMSKGFGIFCLKILLVVGVWVSTTLPACRPSASAPLGATP